jgi:UDP-glucose:glycoprotein glucosyltransferase
MLTLPSQLSFINLFSFHVALGIQCTQLIMESSNPLRTLTQLSQNFPRYATAIARRVIVKEEVQLEVSMNHMSARPGFDMVWLNGATVQEKDMNPFA